ncbi:hypothetical protein NFHSH190041_02740 [Shewanella sp. NFH-SH190041]|uniref:STM4011 family radical SAM protein n=1 Tax=Shewanella sp. NFH-SH190041 TaxID=2950245 RepID=UPI0021C2DC4C|nr:STM4011 family radical SAM protein [Shewanella sp. NFH-SH190041]BDM62822.1 hypothetical protein NFHSH190041_02740 [Shewanella sp. NFH-SH190041]
MLIDITYRGPLASCNYSCGYCPFATMVDSAATRQRDKQALTRFYHWLTAQPVGRRFRILFTPWGEALVKSWYRQAVVAISQLPNVQQLVVQTNLSGETAWLAAANRQAVALWITYHPTQVSLAAFISQTKQLDALGINYSVGCVGMKAHKAEIAALRLQLPESIYLWVNAFKDEADYYCAEDIAFFQQIDPLFQLNLTDYPSQGQACRAGVSALSLDGEGNVRPCHFVSEIQGNIYRDDLEQILHSQYQCPNRQCDCYIGYIHLEQLRLEQVYGDNILARIPIN